MHSSDNPTAKDQAEPCRKSGPIEICKDISSNGVRTSINGPSVEFQNEVGGVKVEFAQGKANAYATSNTIDVGWGLSFVKVSGNLYMPVFDLGDKRIEMNVGLAVGVGGGEGIVFERSSNEQHIEIQKPTEISAGHTQQKNKETYQGSATYTPFPGIPVTGSFEVTIIDKKDLSRTTTNMPAEFGALILETLQFDPFAQAKQAQTFFTDFLKSKNIKFATEDELRQFAKEEAEKFKNGEGVVYKYISDAAANAKKAKPLTKDDLAQAEQIFGELSQPFQIAGAMHFFAGNNRVANKFFGAAQTVSNMPKMAETVGKNFAMAGGLFSGKIALSTGSIVSAGIGVLSGIGTITAGISMIASLFGGSDNGMEELQEAMTAYFQHLDAKMDVVIKIGNETLVISHKIYDAVKNNFFAQQLNHQEVVALLVEHFMKIHEQSSSAHSLLGQSYSLISDESAELRSMLQEERYAAIQKMHDVVLSKLARKLSTFNDFLEKEFDTLYHEARIANAGNTLTAGNKPCNLENMNSLLAHFKDIRRFRAPDDFYTVFNVINLIQECATNPKLDRTSLLLEWNITKLNNLIGIYIQVDTLAKIIERLKKEKQNIREMLPEIDKQIKYAEEQVAKISEFLNRLSADIKRVEEALIKVQKQAREDAARFHENAQSQIAHSNAPLVLKEKLAVENELSWGRTHYAYPDLWKKPGLTHEENMQLSHCEQPVTVPPMDQATWESTVDGVVGQKFHGVPFLGIKMQAIAWSDQGLLAKFMETCKQTPRITTDNLCDIEQSHHLRFFDEHRSPCAMPYGNPYNYPCKPTFLTPLQATHDFEKFFLSKHNSELYQELRQLSTKDLAQEQKLYFERLHQQNMQLLEQPSSSDKPLLRHILPAKSYNDGKGIALRVPNWLLNFLKNEILAEQLGIGHLELFYNGDKKNQFIVDIEFVFKKDNSRVQLYQFSDQLDKYVCATTNYQQMDRIAYYWYGGVYCSPSAQRKISYLAISSPYLFHSIYDATFAHRARTDKRIFKTINFPLYRHHSDHWSMSTMPEGAVLAKMPQYENHQVVLAQAIKQQQITNRNALNTHMRDNILQKQLLGQALDYFEFNLRMQHHILMMKAPVPSTAKSLHEKLLKIAQQCDREASLDFIDQYQGGEDYLESRYQICVTTLKALDTEVATIPKTGNYLLKQTQEKISALKIELQSPEKNQVEQIKQQMQNSDNQHARPQFEPQNNGGFKPSPLPENRSRRNIDESRIVNNPKPSNPVRQTSGTVPHKSGPQNSPPLLESPFRIKSTTLPMYSCDGPPKETMYIDPLTGEVVFDYSITWQGREIAGISYLGDRGPCQSADGSWNNIIEQRGLFKGRKFHVDTDNVCSTVPPHSSLPPPPKPTTPPSFSEIAFEGAVQGARMGVMRGAANVVGGKNFWRATGLFYGGYCLYRLQDAYQQNPNQDCWSAMYKAGSETLWLAASEIVISQASKGMKAAGNYLQNMKNTNAQLAGIVTSKLSNAVGYTFYAYDSVVAWQASPTSFRTLVTRVVSNVASGCVAQQATEKVGAMIGSAIRFFKSHKVRTMAMEDKAQARPRLL